MKLKKKAYQITKHGRFFLSHVTTPFLSLHSFSVDFKLQKFLTSFQQNFSFKLLCR